MKTTSLQDCVNVASFERGNFRIEIYINGSSLKNPGPSGWAFVAILIDGDGKLIGVEERSCAGIFISTNNRAELAAALNALCFVKHQQASGVWPICPVTIHSNSEYIVKGMTERLALWFAKGWRGADGKAPKNRDLWERLKAAAEGFSLGWRSVRGHDGNRWNVRVYELAKNAAMVAARKGVTVR